MNVDIESVSPSRSVLHIVASAEEAAAKAAEVVKEIAKTASLPGFRKGKLPLNLVEKKFESRIASELRNRLISTMLSQVQTEKKDEISIYEAVVVNTYEKQEDGSYKIDITVDLEPSFTLPKFEDLSIQSVHNEVTDADVEKEVENFRRSFAQYKDAEADYQIKTDDMASLSFSGKTPDGKALAEVYPDAAAFAEKDKAWCTAGSAYFLVPGVSQDIIGKKLNDTATIEVEFPADFRKECLRGVKAVYTYTVKTVRVLEIPEINGEMLSKHAMKSLDELRERIRTKLTQARAEDDRMQNLMAASKALCNSVQFELPEAAYDRMLAYHIDMLLRYSMNCGASEEELSKQRDELTQGARESAATALKEEIILSRIQRENNVELTGEDVHAAFVKRVQRERMNRSDAEALARNKDAMRSLARGALREKLLAFVLEKAGKQA